MWVIKLDGDLLHDPAAPHGLAAWLTMLATFGGGRVTVVPGAGAFADPVLLAQRQWGFSELTAHNMQVMAMVQAAEMLHALEPRLRLVREDADIRQTLHAGACAVWQPYIALRDAPDALITAHGFRSDCLALWLAQRLNAERVVVVKTLAPPAPRRPAPHPLDRWRRDAAFTMNVVEPADLDQVRAALVNGS